MKPKPVPKCLLTRPLSALLRKAASYIHMLYTCEVRKSAAKYQQILQRVLTSIVEVTPGDFALTKATGRYP